MIDSRPSITYRRSRFLAYIYMCLTLLMLSACGGEEGLPVHNTVTLRQANETVDRYVEQILREFSVTADKNDQLALSQPDAPCTAESSNYDKYFRQAQRAYPMNGLDKDDLPRVFDTFTRWTHNNGFTLYEKNAKGTEPAYRARNKDGYKVGVEFAYGTVNVVVSSPCVWRNGHPQSDGD